jgi:hypothetical protein
MYKVERAGVPETGECTGDPDPLRVGGPEWGADAVREEGSTV